MEEEKHLSALPLNIQFYALVLQNLTENLLIIIFTW